MAVAVQSKVVCVILIEDYIYNVKAPEFTFGF